MKRALIAILGMVMVSCAIGEGPKKTIAPKASWQEIEANAAAIDGNQVAVCGWFVAEFEGCEVSKSIPANPGEAGQIWIAPNSDICSLEKVTAHPTEGWAEISGTFHYSQDPNKGFGQFGMFRSAIGKAVVKMRKMPCDK